MLELPINPQAHRALIETAHQPGNLLVQLDYNGWRPMVMAERLAPHEWMIAVHPDPWTMAHLPLGSTPPDGAHWCVSDAVTGRLISIEPKRSRAITSAMIRLERAAEWESLSVPALLASLRAPLVH